MEKLKSREGKGYIPMEFWPYLQFGLIFLFYICVQYLYEWFPADIQMLRSIWDSRGHMKNFLLFYFLR